MNTEWVIKAVYASGGHVYVEKDGVPRGYPSEQLARAACEVLNAVNRQPDTQYIPVPKEY